MKSQAVVETCFLGPTNHRPSKVRVKHVTTGARRFVSGDPALDQLENHREAAKLVLGFEPTWYASVSGGGYLFGGDRANV